MTTTEKIRVLTIEDDPLLLDLLAQKITAQGWDVYTATDAEIGLQTAEAAQPHIILLDILLPGTSGHEFLRTIKEKPELASIPILVLSNYGEEKEIAESLALGAVKHLVKAHSSPGAIIEKVIEVLNLPTTTPVESIRLG